MPDAREGTPLILSTAAFPIVGSAAPKREGSLASWEMAPQRLEYIGFAPGNGMDLQTLNHKIWYRA